MEKTPRSPLGSKEIKSVNLKGNQRWVLIGRTDDEAETPVFCSTDENTQLIGKVPDAGKDWGQKLREHQRIRCLDGITDAMDINLGKLQMVRDREGWHAAVCGVAKSQTWLGNWTTAIMMNPQQTLFSMVKTESKFSKLKIRKLRSGTRQGHPLSPLLLT